MNRLLLSLFLALPALAQPEPAFPEIELAEPVRRLIEGNVLDDAQRKQTRLFHGFILPDDIALPADRARAALARGALRDPAFDSPDAAPIDRAEAALLRGEPEKTLPLLEDDDSVRAARIRAEALASLGRFDDARAELNALLTRMQARELATPEDLTEGVRALILRERLIDPGPRAGAAASDYNTLASLLARVRDEMDRLYWPALVVEAELLYDKDNASQAQEAALAALRLNPAAARAWALLGEMAVDSFSFPQAAAIADRLDKLSQDLGAGPSPDAALIRSRARLRQSDPDGASEVLVAARAVYPTHRALLALHAAAEAARFDDAASAALLAEFESLAPGSPDAHLAIGVTLSDARQYALAADALERACRAMPTWPKPWIELGLMELQAGRDLNAKDALAQAHRLDPFNVRADNSLRLITELATYHTLESDHFIVRYKPGRDEVLAREMLPILEQVHARVCGDARGGIRHEPDRKTLIELMPDHHWFSVRITGMPRVHTMAASTGPVIAMEPPAEGHGHVVGPYDWARVIQHEYTHTVTLSRTHNRIPHWFTEAAAVYLEDGPRPTPWIALLTDTLKNDALFDLDEISIAFVRPKGPNDRQLAYAQGHWMYEFMIERFGDDAPLRLMDRYALGATQAEALSAEFNITREDFLAKFREWARAQVVAWGLLPKDDEPTLKQLLAEMYAQPGAPGAPTLEIVESWLEKYPTHAEALRMASRLALEQARGVMNDAAADYLERLAAALPEDAEPRRDLTRYYLSSNQGAKAIPHLEWLDAREQHSPAYALELARQYALAAAWPTAHAKAERATRIAPFDADSREFAAAMAIKAGALDDAQRHIEALTILEPDRQKHKDRLEALKNLRAQN